MLSTDRVGPRFATRLLFLVAGFGCSCWAPLVPFVKFQLGIDEDVLGILLLCIGCGSLGAVVVTGVLTTRLGSKSIIVGAGVGFAVALALLPLARTVVTLGLALVAFGATLGALGVAMNLHAVEVERTAGKPLMSGFHAHFSIGGFTGSAFMTFLLSKHVSTTVGALICSGLMLATMVITAPRLLNGNASKEGPMFAIPRGIVLLIAILASITFLVEGALLDWSALLITESGLVSVAHGGMGYMLFSVAMTGGRLCGDTISERFGDRNTLLVGGALGIFGFSVLLTATSSFVAMSGFVVIGLSCSNIVPVLFRRSAMQKLMSPGLAIAAISTTGFTGALAGPAGIGFLAKAAGLHVAFWALAVLLALVPLSANVVAPKHS